MMEHDEILTLLELAAVEPAGFDRLAAGDTTDAALVAGHLAGCTSCAAEADRLRSAVPILREVIRSIPPADLRDRTLAFVREVGRPRRREETRGAGEMAVFAKADAPPDFEETLEFGPDHGPDHGSDLEGGDPGWAAPGPGRGRSRWVAAIAAVIAISLVGGGVVADLQFGQQLRDRQALAADLASLDRAMLRLLAEPDVRSVALSGGAGISAAGRLVFSATSRELVVSAAGLQPPDPGQQLACWLVNPGSQRQQMGTMVVEGGLIYWAGWDEALARAGPGTQFGVTLIDAGGAKVGDDLLVGTVGSP